MKIDVNMERVLLEITGSFEGVQAHLVKIIIRFPLTNQKEFPCIVETITNHRLFIVLESSDDSILACSSLICNLTVPKQPMDGILSVDIKPGKTLEMGDADTSGSMELTDLLSIYVRIFFSFFDDHQDDHSFQVPKPNLSPDRGPAAGGTRIRIGNLSYDPTVDLNSTMKISLGKQPCFITEYNSLSFDDLTRI